MKVFTKTSAASATNHLNQMGTESLPACRTRTTTVASWPTLRKESAGFPVGSVPGTISIQQLTLSRCFCEGDGKSLRALLVITVA